MLTVVPKGSRLKTTHRKKFRLLTNSGVAPLPRSSDFQPLPQTFGMLLGVWLLYAEMVGKVSVRLWKQIFPEALFSGESGQAQTTPDFIQKHQEPPKR